MMSGKPEQQAIQNVVVYVSAGDNFSAHSYSVGQQNVALQHPQTAGLASATPLTCKKSGLKAEFVNGIPNPGSLYPPSSLQTNGYTGAPNLHPFSGGSPAAAGILKAVAPHLCAGPHLDTLSRGAEEQQICGSYASHAGVCFDKGPADADHLVHGSYVASERGGGDARGFVALCGEASPTAPGGPRASSRCDSARSEAAESSCSSLSSEEALLHPGAVVCRTAGQILLPPGMLSSAGIHFPPGHQAPDAVQSYIACPGGGVVLGNPTVVLNGQQALGAAAAPHHAGNLVLTMAMPQLVPTGGQVLQAFTTVGSLAPNGPLAPPPTVTLAHSATHSAGGAPISSQPLLHPSPVGVISTLHPEPSAPALAIPFGWKRLVSAAGAVVYVSPSSTQLTSLDHVKEYLQTQGTCKCGLECPLKFETVFNFDPKVPCAAMPPAASHDLARLCSHKRRTAEERVQQRTKRDASGVSTTSKRKKRKGASPNEGLPQVYAAKDQQAGIVGAGALLQTFPRPQRLTPVAGVPELHSALPQAHLQQQQQRRLPPAVAQLWNANERDSPTPVRTPVLPVLPTSSFGPALVPVSSSNMQTSTSSPSSTSPAVNFHLSGSVGYGAGGILVHSGSNGFTPGSAVNSGYGLQGMSVVGGRIMFSDDISKGQSLNPETVLKVQQHFPPGTRLVADEGCKVPRNLQHHHFVPNGIVAAPSLEAYRPQIPQGHVLVDSIGVRTFQAHPNISIPSSLPNASTVQAQTFERASASHYQQWEDLCKKKKGNSPNFISNIPSKIKRTKYSGLERDSSPCPNVDVRQIPVEHRLPPPNVSGSYTIVTAHSSLPNPSTPSLAHSTGMTTVMGVPSFMEDPTAYLAQQTALLNSTISRQTGGNLMFGGGDAVSSDRQTASQALDANHSGLISSSTVGIAPHHPGGVNTTKTGNMHGQTAPVSSSCSLPKSCSNVHMANLINTASSATLDSHAIQSFISTSPSLGGCHQTMTTVSTTTSIPVSICQSQVTSASAGSQNIIYQSQSSKPNVQVHHQQLVLRHPLNQFFAEHSGAPRDLRMQQNSNNSNSATALFSTRSDICHNNPHQRSEEQFLHVSSPNQAHRHIIQTGSNFSVVSSQGQHQPTEQEHPSPDDNPVTSSTFLEKSVCEPKDVSMDTQQLQVSQSVSQSNRPAQFKLQQIPAKDQRALQVYPQQQVPHFANRSQESKGPIQGGTVSTSQMSTATQGVEKTEDNSSERGHIVMEGYSVTQVEGHCVMPEEGGVPSSTQKACQALDGNIFITSTSSSGSSNGGDNKTIGVGSASNNSCQYSPSVVTTMASGHTVSSNTITSVQAGKASTITVSGGNTTTSTPPVSSPAHSFSSNPATQTFVSVSSSSNSKSPLEMVQSVVSSIQVPCNQPQGLDLGGSLIHSQQISMGQPAILKTSPSGLPSGHFLVSNGNGQFIVASATGVNNAPVHNGGPGQLVKFHPPSSSAASIPLVATQPVMQLVNALPVGGGPPQLHLLQHQHQHCHSDIHQMAVGLPVDGPPRTVHAAELVGAAVQQPHLQPQVISPGISKRKGKKRKPSPQAVTSMLHITTQHQQQHGQSPVGHHLTQQQVVVPGSTTSYAAPGGMLQAVAFVPGGGKFLMNQFATASSGGAPAANNGTAATAYGTIGHQVSQISGSPQHLLTAASSSQALHTTGVNLLQPLSLGSTPGTATLLQNFPFQQLIGSGATVVAAVPGIQGMVMSALPDGTLLPTGGATSTPDASNQALPPLQLHLQNLNGQNVLTQVQPAPTQSIFGQAINPHHQQQQQQHHTLHPHSASPAQPPPPHHQLLGTGGVVIRGHVPSALPSTQHHHIDGKAVQPQPQTLLPQGQFLVNGSAAGSAGNPGALIPHGPTLHGSQQITVNQATSADSFVGGGGAVLRPSAEFLHCSGNLLVPISQQQLPQPHPRQAVHTAPSPLPHAVASSHQPRAQMNGSQPNATVVQQNTTTIVQQQTMMVSSNQSSNHQQMCHQQSTPSQASAAATGNFGAPGDMDSSSLSQRNVTVAGGAVPLHLHHYAGARPTSAPVAHPNLPPSAAILLRHSVSTQTAVNQSVQATSPPVYVTTMQSPNRGLLSASTCYIPAAALPSSRPPHTSGEAGPQGVSAQSSSELIGGNSAMATARSPPDTTTHSATASPADTTTSEVASNIQASISSTSAACLVSGSAECFTPSRTPVPNQSSCGVSPTRGSAAEVQCSVHLVSSSEPEPSPSGMMSVGILSSPPEELSAPVASGPECKASHSLPLQHDSAVTSGLACRGMYAEGRSAARVGGEKASPVESTVVVGYTGGVHSSALQGEGREVVLVTSEGDGGKLCSAGVQLVGERRSFGRKHSDTLVVEKGCSEGLTDEEERKSAGEEQEQSPRVFAVGDLVWGQARGCPSWPGKLVSAQDAGHAKGSKVWVQWFGDQSPMQVEAEQLKTLSEGLEAHHRARKKYRKGRKMNAQLENAIQEAMVELDRITEGREAHGPWRSGGGQPQTKRAAR